MYFDDANLVDWKSSKGSGQYAFSVLNELLGTFFAAEKKQAMSEHGVFLGLQHSLSGCLHSGTVRFWSEETLETKLCDLISDARQSAKLTPGLASKIYGVANFFEQGVYGPIGCGGLSAIKDRQYEHHTSLSPELLDCFSILESIIQSRISNCCSTTSSLLCRF